MASYVFTSESVSAGHPDKVCDQISDALLDAYLTLSPYVRVAIESVATTNRVILVGEVSHLSLISQDKREEIVRDVIRRIGYTQEGFHWQTCIIEDYLHDQSADIAVGVAGDAGKVLGAGDQGMMFGYASLETPAFMPAPIYYAHRVLEALRDARLAGLLPGIEPDAKTQLSVRYEDSVPAGVDCVVLSTQHAASLSQEDVRRLVTPIVREALPSGWMKDDTLFYVNPTGAFVVGGPVGDAGLTGRKIIVDTYGGRAPHGGGAFSGKDPTKVDRSGAYMARYLAKNIVAAGLARSCTLQLSYAIGVAKPVSLYLDLHGSGMAAWQDVAAYLESCVDMTPQGIIDALDLRRPIYERTASYGHFGRSPDEDGAFGWERLDLMDALIQEFKTEADRFVYMR